MIETVIKRDGSEEPFIVEKLIRWFGWGAKGLEGRVDSQAVIRDVIGRMRSVASSQELQKALIEECLNRATWSYYLLAGRLFAALRRKEIYGDVMPTVQALQRKLYDRGIMRHLNYSDADYAEIERIIDHSQDFHSPHFSLKYIDQKYGLQDRVTGEVYETPQYTYMRMAMVIYESEPDERRLTLVREMYELFSEKILSAPTPNYVSLGLTKMGLASCCLYTTADDGVSLATGDYIANVMTQSGAGIGSTIISRGIGEAVRNGVIKHAGKLPYYRAAAGSITANKQGSRGGAGNVNYQIFDPEAPTIAQLRNPRAIAAKRIRELHYTLQSNPFLDYKVACNEPIFAFTCKTAPDLFEAFYSADLENFVRLYQKYEADANFPKTYHSARDLVYIMLKEAYETGTAYFNDMYEINHHTPFKDRIHGTNLCVAGETKILTDNGEFEIGPLVGTFQNVWNGQEWSEVEIIQTGESQQLLKIAFDNDKTLECTHYHKFYVVQLNGSVRETIACELKVGDLLEPFVLPGSPDIHYVKVTEIVDEGRRADTFCFTEEKRFRGIFNGILTGQCVEVCEPTVPYMNAGDLYLEEDHGRGEVALCNLFGINVHKVTNKQYPRACYHGLRMVDFCIHSSDYKLPHVGYTAKQRMNAAGGIMGLASHMAKNRLKFSSFAGKQEIHFIHERHMYWMIKASLEISKERGLAPWIHKTKWPEGWLPLDTYNRNVDKIGDFGLTYDWEALRAEIIANGGLAHSVLVAHMPGESSSKALGETNSLYPVRRTVIKKTDGGTVIYWAAPESDNPDYEYELAYNINTRDMSDCYALGQKWTDQAISCDFYRRINPEIKLSSAQLIEDEYLYPKSKGLKSRYYQNSEITDGIDLEEMQSAFEISASTNCTSGACSL